MRPRIHGWYGATATVTHDHAIRTVSLTVASEHQDPAVLVLDQVEAARLIERLAECLAESFND